MGGQITDLLLKDCENNDSGTLGYALVAFKSDFTTLKNTYAEESVPFVVTDDYAEDDLVTYDCEVYKCTVAHSAGAWDAGNFTLIPNGHVRINGTHALEGAKTFIRMEINEEESTISFESLGKKFSRSGKQSAQLFHPGSSLEASQFNVRATMARQAVVLVPLANGKVVQLGTKNSFAEIVGGKTAGTRENPDSRWLFEVSNYAKSEIYYQGTLPV